MNALTFKRVAFAVVVLASVVGRDALGQVQYTVTDLGTLGAVQQSKYSLWHQQQRTGRGGIQ